LILISACARPPVPRVSEVAGPLPPEVAAVAVSAAPATSAAPVACEPLRDLGEIVSVDASPPLPPIVDASESMARFYDKLARLARWRATDHVRVAMYGDSNVTLDYLSGEIRRVFQKRFGDGGHGFVTSTKHLNYRHMDVEHGASDGWLTFTLVNQPAPDRIYGLGLVVERAAPVVVAVLLDELERAGLPVFSLRVDDVEVREEEERTLFARAVQTRDEVHARRGRTENAHVAREAFRA
jgi:hypothetical protein